jgi:hypothetical protein
MRPWLRGCGYTRTGVRGGGDSPTSVDTDFHTDSHKEGSQLGVEEEAAFLDRATDSQ